VVAFFRNRRSYNFEDVKVRVAFDGIDEGGKKIILNIGNIVGILDNFVEPNLIFMVKTSRKSSKRLEIL